MKRGGREGETGGGSGGGGRAEVTAGGRRKDEGEGRKEWEPEKEGSRGWQAWPSLEGPFGDNQVFGSSCTWAWSP